MGLFKSIDDPLTQRLDESYSEILRSIREIKSELGIKSYKDMGQSDDFEKIHRLEQSLARTLAPKIETDFKESTPKHIIKAFASSYLLWKLYPETVGAASECISTVELKNFPMFKIHQPRLETQNHVFEAFCKRHELRAREIDQIRKDFVRSEQKIDRKRKLVSLLRSRLEFDESARPTQESIHRLFSDLFVGHPMAEEEVSLVATQTGIYFCLPTRRDMRHFDSFKKRSEAQKKKVYEYLKEVDVFRFEYFAHFPVFSLFDAREISDRYCKSLAEEMGLPLYELRELLNSVCMVLKTSNVEKYFIHDTWGHVWQADLTLAKHFYDKLTTIRYPLSADRKVRVGEAVISFSDLIYVKNDGKLFYDRELARLFIEEVLREKVSSLVAPITAELCADITEYNFLADHAYDRKLLPSSSLFATNAAKIDFAWTDIQYFTRMLLKPHKIYVQNPELKTHFVGKLAAILKIKYPRNFKKIKSQSGLKKELSQIFEKFLKDYARIQDEHLNVNLDLEEVNSFFQLFTNHIRIQLTVNRIFMDLFERDYKHLKQYREVVIIFILKYFEQNPLENFWSLDETLAENIVPMLEEISRLERES